MNSVQASLLALGLVLIFGAYSGEAIKCHVCNSYKAYDGEKCADPIETDEFLMDCNDYATEYQAPEFANATLCRKQTQKVQGDYRVVRSCAVTGRTDRCVDRTGTKAVKVKYCECEGDGCNSASGVFASVILVSITALLSKVLH